MMKFTKAHPLLGVGLCFLLSPAVAQDDHPVAGRVPDRAKIALSESVKVTFTVEAAAPLRVERGGKLLAAEAEPLWSVKLAGPAKVESAGAGRERWTQTVEFSPWVPGETVPLGFAPVKVTAGGALNPTTVTWDRLDIRVQTAVAEADPKHARNVTGIEDLPPLPVDPPDRVGWLIAAGTAGLFLVAVLVALRRRWTAAAVVPPDAWAATEFDRLERDAVTGRELADRLADVLREFVERRFGLPAPRLTTAELIAAWPTDDAGELRELLERCDRAKFAGDAPDQLEGGELVRKSREWAAGRATPV